MGFNTASGMRSHVTYNLLSRFTQIDPRFNTASGMRSHVTAFRNFKYEETNKVSIPQAV